VRDYLTEEELEMLLKLHPGGTARFWGAKPSYNSKIDLLAVGDPVLFMGDYRVQAIGKVGCKIRKQALANELWRPEPGEDSWTNVYSVLDFRRVSDLLYRTSSCRWDIARVTCSTGPRSPPVSRRQP
jgi:hypothetical protein